MHPILKTWYLSLALLYPSKLLGFFQSTMRVFIRSIGQFIIHFGWLVFIDAFFSLAVGDILAKSLAQVGASKPLSSPIAIVMLVQSVIWFLASSAFFLLIRKDDATHPKNYFKLYFFRYVQILLSFSCLFLLFIYFLLSTGMTKLPHVPWILFMVAKTVEIYIIFYWLDSKGYFLEVFKSCEKAINLLFYNMPVILFFLLIAWTSNYAMCLLANVATGVLPEKILFFQTSLYAGVDKISLGLSLKILGIKYLTFLIEYFWICIVFVFYRRKKHEQYAVSLFEQL